MKKREEKYLKSTYNESEGFYPLYVGKLCFPFKNNHMPSGGNVAFWDHLHLTDQK